MAPSVQFGMLQRLKTQDFTGNQAAKSIQTELNNQLTIFQEAKQNYEKVSASGEQGTSATTGAFAQTSMSVSELENKMQEEQEKLEKLMTQLQAEADKGNKPQGENEDDKNKIQPKQFGGLMA